MRKSDFIFRYRVRNWPAYNRALVRRGSLTFWVDEEAVRGWTDSAGSGPRGGRPRVYYLWRPTLPDEADNHVVELAVAGGAEVIVTHNTRDFVRAELHFPGLRVLRPDELIAEN